MVRKVVFVLGPPGVGKGTQCRNIALKYDFVHISAGELLRRERSTPNSQHGELINSFIKEGKIVPAEITCKLLEQEMASSGMDKFLIDGFPRNLENKEGWDKAFSEVEVLCVLFIDCPVDVCIQRCLSRGGAAGNDRLDDNVEILKKRIETHTTETRETIDFYTKMNLVKFVDGNKSEEAVFEDIKKIFDNTLLIKK